MAGEVSVRGAKMGNEGHQRVIDKGVCYEWRAAKEEGELSLRVKGVKLFQKQGI